MINAVRESEGEGGGERTRETGPWRHTCGEHTQAYADGPPQRQGGSTRDLKDLKRAKDDSFSSAQQTEGWKESNLTWQELFSTSEFGQSFALDSELVEYIFHPNYISNSSQLFLSCYNSHPPAAPRHHTHHPSPSSIPIFSKAFSIPMSHFVKPFRDFSLMSGGGFWTCRQGLLQLQLGSLSPLPSHSSLVECLAVP